MKLGVIAGAGALPVILAQEAKRAGRELLIISITKGFDERLSSLTPEFYQIGAGRLKNLITTTTVPIAICFASRAGRSDCGGDAARAAIARKPERHEFREKPQQVVRFMAKTGG